MEKTAIKEILDRVVRLKLFRQDHLYTEVPVEPASRIVVSKQLKKLFLPRRSVYFRHLDCGSCNGCELELVALENPIYDIHHQGFEFKASPRHADVLLMTGPFTRNLAQSAILTLEAMTGDKFIVTIGDCTQGGGIFAHSYALVEPPALIRHAIERTGIHVQGCPPHPRDVIAALEKLDPQIKSG